MTQRMSSSKLPSTAFGLMCPVSRKGHGPFVLVICWMSEPTLLGNSIGGSSIETVCSVFPYRDGESWGKKHYQVPAMCQVLYK